MELDDLEDSNEASLEDFPRGTKRKGGPAEADSEEDDEESNPEDSEEGEGEGEGEGDEDEEGEDEESAAKRRKLAEAERAEEEKKHREETTKKIGEMMKHFTPEQQNRYEAYRRSAFGKNGIKKAQPLSLSHQHHHQPISRAITRLMQSVAGGNVSQKTAIVMAGVSKIFVGEIVETARTVMEEWAETGPIRPRHLREAYRRLQLKGKIPSAATYSQKRLFRK